MDIKSQSTTKELEWLYRWIRLRQENIFPEAICRNYRFRKIALYGYNRLSICMAYELENSTIDMVGIIDRRYGSIESLIPVLELDSIDDESDIDAIIVCVRSNYEDIVSDLRHKLPMKVLSIEDFLYEI